jgi:hypothetical protein
VPNIIRHEASKGLREDDQYFLSESRSLGGEMEAQEMEAWRAQTQQGQKIEPENREVAAPHVGPQESITAENEALEVDENEISAAGTCAGDACAANADAGAEQARALDAPISDVFVEEDETQLAAIRELMTRTCARGIWLTLAEIAEATEFGEASISAQLRHLRKPYHGGYHVEKRHRRPARGAATMHKIRDARRGPVIWEYRVLPPA